MKNFFKKSLILVGIYLVFVLYLFMVCSRFEQLEEEKYQSNLSVSIKFGE